MEIYTREFCRYIKPDSPITRWQIVVYDTMILVFKGLVCSRL